MRSHFFSWQNHQPKMLLVFIIVFFSHMAYSADPIVCTPNGYRPEIHINQDITVTPAGYGKGTGYVAPIPVALQGPVTCANYTPTGFTIMAFGQTFVRYPNENAEVNIGHNFMALLGVSTSPGLVSDNDGNSYDDGNTPNITQNYYPQIFIYPPTQKGPVPDFYVSDTLIGYIEITGRNYDGSYIATDPSGMTAVYYSGMIHVPPYCEFSNPNAMVTMPTVFASDFVAAGVGGNVGPRSSLLQEEVTCSGGSTSGDDLVHISISSGNTSPVDSTDVIGISGGNTDIGIHVFDGDGNKLPVNGPVAATLNTHPTVKGTEYFGQFNYQLQFQLVSLTGKAPPPDADVSNYTSIINISLTMD